jgi:hypothetical protein
VDGVDAGFVRSKANKANQYGSKLRKLSNRYVGRPELGGNWELIVVRLRVVCIVLVKDSRIMIIVLQ